MNWIWWKAVLIGDDPIRTLVFCVSCIAIGAVAIMLRLMYNKRKEPSHD